jgi:hypothetical protein
MSITGGVKFFDESQFVYGDSGVSITATTGNLIAHHALDRNPATSWQSVGSDDTITEELIWVFPPKTLTRLIFRNINWKEFNVKYLLSGVWTDFAGVSGLDGSKANISETAFADDTAYYEFNSVAGVTSIRAQVKKTQVANEQKYVFQILGFTELGTLQGFPDISPWNFSLNQRSKKMLSGKHLITPGEDTFAVRMGFQAYPASYEDDLDLLFTLFRRRRPFNIWLCGGRRGDTYFKYQAEGMRLQDIYQVMIDSDLSPGFRKNHYRGSIDLGNILFRQVGGNSEATVEENLNYEQSIANGQVSAADITYLALNKDVHVAAVVEYDITRKTDSASSEKRTNGKLRIVYRVQAGTWHLEDEHSFDSDDGVEFSITSAGQVQYTSDTISGDNYVGTIRWKARYFDA